MPGNASAPNANIQGIYDDAGNGTYAASVCLSGPIGVYEVHVGLSDSMGASLELAQSPYLVTVNS